MKAPHISSPVAPWNSPPETFVLGRNEVHVWQASLEQNPSQIQSFLHNLSADERSRADRFYFARDREHFIVARGVLREILGCYLKQAPKSLCFCYGSHGKPALAGKFDGEALHFNVSHSHGIALYAISRGRAVGIDIERIRFDLPVAEIAERFFSKREDAMLRSLPTDVQHQAFFRCWTRKEAYSKARGEGLALPLDQLDLSLTSEKLEAAPGAERVSGEASRWSLQEIIPASGYVAALAVEAHDWRLACWQWPDARRQSV